MLNRLIRGIAFDSRPDHPDRHRYGSHGLVGMGLDSGKLASIIALPKGGPDAQGGEGEVGMTRPGSSQLQRADEPDSLCYRPKMIRRTGVRALD